VIWAQEEEADGEEEAAAPARKRGAFGFLSRQKPAAADEEEEEEEDEAEPAPKAAPRATQRRSGGAPPPPPPADEPCAPRQLQCSWHCVENLASSVYAGVRGAPAGGARRVTVRAACGPAEETIAGGRQGGRARGGGCTGGGARRRPQAAAGADGRVQVCAQPDAGRFTINQVRCPRANVACRKLVTSLALPAQQVHCQRSQHSCWLV
jgi:hypothetical protein